MSTVYDVAVVGSGGFLGGAITRELGARGHQVATFTRQDPLVVGGQWAARAAHVNAVVWAAGAISPVVAHERPDLVDAELAAFAAFVDAAAALPVVPRIVLLSSGGAIYGRPGFPAYRETDDPHPANAYGAFKLEQERILAGAHETTTAVRIANAYGPGQRGARGQGVLAIWMRAILAGRPITILGTGEVERDYVYVGDAVDAIARVVERADAPPVLNVGSGHPTHLNDLLDLVEYVVGHERVRVERLPARGVDPDSTWLDVSLARESLAWMPSTPLADGIARMWAWAQSA
ncbi:NAD-dependent epimerase/dehydratase family protein [Demequina sp.]|uniref:NAD-dependent epimerase/dehydratase family protein n=1 Tax=Demequina sp. TaxID=2050685 RepID=UPI0025EABCDA|nr:NAD-dependent epimerase/dehydratase family protein [Demequina sp.]